MKRDTKPNFRIKLQGGMGHDYYVVRTKGNITFISGNETPHALSNIAGSNAAMLRFQLEDARDGNAAAKSIRALATLAREVEVI